ncbi:sugar ABC transporter substrate-binding protein [Alicyclobacillus sp. SO9]|uniref:ABC transporter substrate-binding protein n=1 Tax=Alicyclobacillus sp. SO9 TaxID=2665646 RepID=UPI001E4C1A35|nr:sugar ABC transporter substrate-binding protein [Alicyclobacillus sp. SO9]
MKKSRWVFSTSAVLLTLAAVSGCNTANSNVSGSGSGNTTTSGGSGNGSGTTITVATVNNPDMKIMEKLTPNFTKQTGIKVNFVTLPEDQLRNKVTQDVATKTGKFDVVTVSNYTTPIWAKDKWLSALTPMFNKMSSSAKQKYDLQDILQPIRKSLTAQGQLYALPFYGESSMLYYRKDLFKKAGITMPAHPTWNQIESYAKKLNNPSKNTAGILLRGEQGWGESLASLDTVINTFGGEWFNQKWQAQLTSPATSKAVDFYVNLLKQYGEPGATSSGFTELETDMANGKGAMWYDSTVAAGYLSDKSNSKYAKDIGFAPAPVETTKNGHNWLYTWALGVESASKHKQAAFKFITWATSKQYIKLVGQKEGWSVVPPGTRVSTYKNPNYTKAAPFAKLVLNAIQSATPNHPTKNPVPYKGVQFVGIPEFQSLGNKVSQNIANAISGKESVAAALKQSQKEANQMAKTNGYQK